jgi:hypothetical protein
MSERNLLANRMSALHSAFHRRSGLEEARWLHDATIDLSQSHEYGCYGISELPAVPFTCSVDAYHLAERVA